MPSGCALILTSSISTTTSDGAGMTAEVDMTLMLVVSRVRSHES
jgi:hypothetical protein